MKSSWTSCGGRSALCAALALALLVAGAVEARKKPRAREELTNFLLGPERSLWLVGAIARIASDDEVERYLNLTSDDDAEAFIEEFWTRRRSSDAVWPAKQPQGVYETRAREADRRFGEGARQGRRSDRGTVYILYGEPEEVKYEVASRPGFPPIEVWAYPKKGDKGLDGKSPQRYYYFTKRGEYTVETVPPSRQRLRRGAFGSS